MNNFEHDRFNFLHYGISHQGKVRKENQDAYGIFSNRGWAVYIVCDGMGGAKGGRVASSLCLEVIGKELEQISTPTIDDLIQLISKANSVLYTCSKRDPALQGMGTTLVLFACLPDGNYSIHVGDSRLYCLKNNNLQILTRDHTYAQELIDSGTLSESSAKRSPISHLLTKAVGTEVSIEPEISLLEDITKTDILILSSDGLYAHLNRKRIEEITLNILKQREEHNSNNIIEKLAKNLIDQTLSAGAADNTTVLVVMADIDGEQKDKFSSFISATSGIEISNEDSATQAILHSAIDASKNSKYKNTAGNSLLSYFLLGISIILGLALWGIIAHEETTDQDALRTSAKLNLAIKQILEERKLGKKTSSIATNSPTLMDPVGAYSFTSEKYAEIFHLPLKAPEIQISENKLHEDLALAPIEWKDDQKIIDSIKSQPQKAPPPPRNDQLGPNERTEILQKKESLIESIWDIDFRITALEIQDKASEEKARIDIVNQKLLVGVDLVAVRHAISELSKRAQSEILQKELQPIEKLLNDPKTITTKSHTIRNLRQRYISEKQNAEFYANLIKESQNQLDLASRLSTTNQKLQLIESQLREEIKNSNEINMESIAEHQAVLTLLEDLISREDKRISRSLGFIGAYTTLNQESKISIWENLIQRRNELYSEHNLLEKSLPSEEDFKEQIRLRRITN